MYSYGSTVAPVFEGETRDFGSKPGVKEVLGGSLGLGMRSLTSGRSFNKALQGQVWPKALETLQFGRDFNQRLRPFRPGFEAKRERKASRNPSEFMLRLSSKGFDLTQNAAFDSLQIHGE